MRKVIFIGGAPASGKSFLARRMSEELKIPWISTDGIRGMMQKIVEKENYPNLFDLTEEDHVAEKYLSTHTPQQIVDDQNAEGLDVWKGVTALIETDYVWRDFIVEGIAVLPELVKQFSSQEVLIKPIFLVDEDASRIRDVVFTRGVWDDAETYSDDVKEVEVQWVTLFNQWLKSEVEKYGFTPTIVKDRDETSSKLIREIQEWLHTS